MPDASDRKRLDVLGRRLNEVRAAREPPNADKQGAAQAQVAWRMVIELVTGLLMGLGIGYGLDSLFGTVPVFLVLFTLLGFAAGVRTMMRTAREVQKGGDGSGGNPGSSGTGEVDGRGGRS